jgi:uncharacterized membrane-anchored protein
MVSSIFIYEPSMNVYCVKSELFILTSKPCLYPDLYDRDDGRNVLIVSPEASGAVWRS